MDLNYSPTDIVWVVLIAAAVMMVARFWKNFQAKCTQKKRSSEPEAST